MVLNRLSLSLSSGSRSSDRSRAVSRDAMDGIARTYYVRKNMRKLLIINALVEEAGVGLVHGVDST
jgi:hypothetical protein